MGFKEYYESLNEAKKMPHLYVKINKNYTSTWRNLNDVEEYLENETNIDKNLFGEITGISGDASGEFIDACFDMIKSFGGKPRISPELIKEIMTKPGWKNVTRKVFMKKRGNDFDEIHLGFSKDYRMDSYLFSNSKGSFWGAYKDIPGKSIEDGDKEDTEFFIKEL